MCNSNYTANGGQNKQARLSAPEISFPLMKNRWVLLRKTIASQTKTGAMRPNLSKSCNLAGTECEVANTSTPVFVITDKTLQAIEKLVDSLKKLGIKYVDGELVYDEEEAGYEYLQ